MHANTTKSGILTNKAVSSNLFFAIRVGGEIDTPLDERLPGGIEVVT